MKAESIALILLAAVPITYIVGNFALRIIYGDSLPLMSEASLNAVQNVIMAISGGVLGYLGGNRT